MIVIKSEIVPRHSKHLQNSSLLAPEVCRLSRAFSDIRGGYSWRSKGSRTLSNLQYDALYSVPQEMFLLTRFA